MGRNWGEIDPSAHEGFEHLGPREQNAARVALQGIAAWERNFEEPKPMKVRVTPENGFNLRGFANFMHQLEVGIAQTLETNEEGVLTFQPTPYSDEFKAKVLEGQANDLSRKANQEAGINNGIHNNDMEVLMDFLRKYSQ